MNFHFHIQAAGYLFILAAVAAVAAVAIMIDGAYHDRKARLAAGKSAKSKSEQRLS
jgi:hypothetical protein